MKEFFPNLYQDLNTNKKAFDQLMVKIDRKIEKNSTGLPNKET